MSFYANWFERKSINVKYSHDSSYLSVRTIFKGQK